MGEQATVHVERSVRGRPGPLAGARLCLVGINYAPETTGIAPYTTAMAQAWLRAGAEVHVVTGVPHYPAWRVTDEQYLTGRRWHEELDGVRVTRVRHHVPAAAGLVGRMRMEASFLTAAAAEVRRSRADAVVAVTPSLAGAAAGVLGARGRPVGVVVQDLTGQGAAQSGSAGRLVGRAIGALEYAALRRATAVGVITPRFGAVLEQHGVRADRLLPTGNFTHITPPTLTAEEARRRLGWPEGVLRVVHTGNMGMKQGLEGVVEAARLADGRGLAVELVLMGDGNQRSALEQLAAGVRSLRMMDPVDAETYPVVLAAADVLLLHERAGVVEMSLPSKVTSYVAAHRPIVAATEPGGITHDVLAQSRAAVLVPPGDPAALLDALVALGDDPARQAALVDGARRLAEEQYGRAAADHRYEDLALRLLG